MTLESLDISGAKLVEEALRQSEERYRLLVENTSDTIALLELDTLKYLYASPSHARMFGFLPEELIGEKAMEFVHSEDREELWEVLQKGIEKGEGSHQYRTRKKDGSYIWLEGSGKIVYREMGRVELLLVCRDIDKTKRVEEELRKSEENYRLIAENAFDLITLISVDSLDYQYVSPSHLRVLGYSSAELMGKRYLNHVHPEDRQYVWDTFKKGIKIGTGIAQYRARKKDGSYIWLETVGKLINTPGESSQVLLVARNINERKSAQEALKQSEEKFRLITENIADIVHIIDPQTHKFIYASPSNSKVMSYSGQEIINKICSWGVHPEDRIEVLESLQQCIIEGEGSVEYRARKKDGSYIWLESVGKMIDDFQEKPGVLIVSRDITARKLYEEALSKSEAKYRLMAENVADIVNIIEPKTYCFRYVSPSNFRVVGFSEEEILGRNCLENVHPEDRKVLLKTLQKVEEEGTGSVQFRCQKKDGTFMWLEANGTMLINSQGKPELLLVSRDISLRKTAEQNLQEQVNYQEALMQNMNELLYTYDREKKLTFANKKTCESMGYVIKEMLGRSILDFVPEAEKEQIKIQVRRRLTGGEPAPMEHTIICKNGSEMLVRIKGSSIIQNGEIIGGLVLAEDITQQRKMEKEMARLGQLNIIGQIAASMGHEIRNPMTTVKGFLQMMNQNKDFIDYRQEFDIMLEELERANSIISEFLSLAKNKLENLQACDLNAIIETLYPLLQADATVSDKSIKLELEEIGELLLDEKEIRQLILNLVRNGLEAMPAGGTVRIKTYTEENNVILRIEDQGSGIDPDLLDKLGTPFLTTKENGTGLGLAVCYGIVAHHHASLEVNSNRSGTTFFIRFPSP